MISCTFVTACGVSVRGIATGLRFVTGSATLDILVISVCCLYSFSLAPGGVRVKPIAYRQILFVRCFSGPEGLNLVHGYFGRYFVELPFGQQTILHQVMGGGVGPM